MIVTQPDAPLAVEGRPCAQESYVAHGSIGSVELRLQGLIAVRLSNVQAKELYDALGAIVTRKPSQHRFKYSKSGAAAVWDAFVKTNSVSPYSRAVIDFAETWAVEMEARMSKVIGATVADVAQDADKFANEGMGLTGAQYGFAVEILVRTWEHGEELRRWHNAKYTPAGSTPPEDGVIHPAMFSVALKE